MMIFIRKVEERNSDLSIAVIISPNFNREAIIGHSSAGTKSLLFMVRYSYYIDPLLLHHAIRSEIASP